MPVKLDLIGPSVGRTVAAVVSMGRQVVIGRMRLRRASRRVRGSPNVIRVPERQLAPAESAPGVKLAVPQELDFGASRLAVVAELTRDVPVVSL